MHTYIKACEYLQLKSHKNLAHFVANCKAVQECVTFIYSLKPTVSVVTKSQREAIPCPSAEFFFTSSESSSDKPQQHKTTQPSAMLSLYQEKTKCFSLFSPVNVKQVIKHQKQIKGSKNKLESFAWKPVIDSLLALNYQWNNQWKSITKQFYLRQSKQMLWNLKEMGLWFKTKPRHNLALS